MKLLAIDTSSSTTVLGLVLDDELIDRSTDTGRSHSRDLLPSIESLMSEAGISLGDLDAIVFGQGPGSFTGLRIAVGVVQGLAYGLDVPAVPVSSMGCLAQGAHRQHGANLVAVALKARLEEVYFGTYGFPEGVAEPLGSEMVVDVRELPPVEAGPWHGAGDGFEFRTAIENALGVSIIEIHDTTRLDVRDLIAIGSRKFSAGKVVSALEARPVYLREQVAQKP